MAEEASAPGATAGAPWSDRQPFGGRSGSTLGSLVPECGFVVIPGSSALPVNL